REREDQAQRLGVLPALAHQYADTPHPLWLLRARRERPRGDRTADERDEVTPFHSITLSARASSIAGTSEPSILAVCRLTTSSNLVARRTGKSAGLSPLRMRPL